MKRFKSFIAEEINPAAAFDRARSISIYLKGRAKERFDEAIDLFVEASNTKSIYNAKFTDAYSYGLSRGVETAWAACREADWSAVTAVLKAEGKENTDWDMYSFSNLNSLKKFERAWAPYKGQFPKQWAFIEAIRDLPDAVKILKTYVTKGKPKAEPKPGQFIKPIAKVDATKKAMEFLRRAVDTFKVEFYNSVRGQFMHDFEKVKSYPNLEELRKAPESIKSMAALVGMTKYVEGKTVFVLHDDAEDRVLKSVHRIVDDIIEEFVGKNTSKLSLIFQKKAEISEHKIIRTRIQNNALENEMFFKFKDNSSFRIVSSVVFKMSPSGKYFSQFPTRFTDVVMADGSKMKMPSEEKMIQEF
jgi:hypothetical protein